MTDPGVSQWLLLIPRVPASPSRHRVAVWRGLRRLGASSVVSGAWALPSLPDRTEAITAIRARAQTGGGNLSVFAAVGDREEDTALLREAFIAARRNEWAELAADCGAFEAELERGVANGELTFDQLEQHRWRMARLRNRQEELLQCNPLSMPEAHESTGRLDAATARLAHYAELVYQANVLVLST